MHPSQTKKTGLDFLFSFNEQEHLPHSALSSLCRSILKEAELLKKKKWGKTIKKEPGIYVL